jgi:hypothetical protein
MESGLIENPSTMLTSPTGEAVIPAALRRYHPRVTKPAALKTLRRLPDVTVVRSERIDILLSHHAFLRALSDRFRQTPEPSKVVFVFEAKASARGAEEGAKQLAALFEYFSRPLDLEVASGIDTVEDAFREALAKIAATRKRVASAELHADPLGKAKRVIAATADLRAPSGKLSAINTAEAFGLSVAELATLIGRNRQAVSKTPDADSLQVLLRPFERVGRLRATLSTDDFRVWLHLANDQLRDRTPLEVIRDGKVGVVVDLVEDMLTGSPT